MTQEALKLALEWFKCYADKSMSRNNAEALANEVVDAIKEALAQPEQEPVAWMDEDGDVLSASIVDGKGLRNIPLYAHPPQRTEQKMVMWPCLIDTADFSKGTVTVVMQCEDYKVSAGTHWLSTSPPKETT